jgi:hypothetical protein
MLIVMDGTIIWLLNMVISYVIISLVGLLYLWSFIIHEISDLFVIPLWLAGLVLPQFKLMPFEKIEL